MFDNLFVNSCKFDSSTLVNKLCRFQNFLQIINFITVLRSAVRERFDEVSHVVCAKRLQAMPTTVPVKHAVDTAF